MNDTSGHREPKPRARSWPALIIGAVLVGTALLASACGGSRAASSAGPPALATLTDGRATGVPGGRGNTRSPRSPAVRPARRMPVDLRGTA